MAAIGFRLAKKYEKAKVAFEKASKGQEMLSSYPHHSSRFFKFEYYPFDVNA